MEGSTVMCMKLRMKKAGHGGTPRIAREVFSLAMIESRHPFAFELAA